MYEVKINFNDNATTSTKRFESFNELGLYLERVPNMLGFQLTDSCSIDISVISAPTQDSLFS